MWMCKQCGKLLDGDDCCGLFDDLCNRCRNANADDLKDEGAFEDHEMWEEEDIYAG